MALVYVGSNAATGNSANYSVSLTALTGGVGSAAQAGDLVIVATGFVSTTNLTAGVSTEGYTPAFAELFANDTRDANLAVEYKVMGATPDTSVTVLGSTVATNGAVTIVHVWRGADPVTPMDVAAQTATSNNSAIPDPPAITPVTPGAVIVIAGLGTGASVDSSVTAPTGYINHRQTTVDPGNAAILAVASTAWSGAGAEDPGAWTAWTTSTSDSWAAATLALRPAPPDVFTKTVALDAVLEAPVGGGGGNTYSDSFDRANEDPITGFTSQTGFNARIVNNEAHVNLGFDHCAMYHTGTVGTAMRSAVVISGALETSVGSLLYGAGPAVFMATGGSHASYTAVVKSGGIQIIKVGVENWELSNLGSYVGTVTLGDTVEIRGTVSGASVQLEVLQNGVSRITTTDSTSPYLTGQFGFSLFPSNDNTTLASWEGGDIGGGGGPVTETKTVAASAVLARTGLTKTVAQTAVLGRVGIFKTVGASAVAARTGLTKSVTASAVLQGVVAKQVDTSAVVQRTGLAKTVALSAWLQGTGTQQVALDAVLLKPANTKTATFDAALMGAGNKTVSLSAVLQGTATKTVATSAVAQRAALTKTVATDALLLQVASKAVAVSAVLARTGLTQSVTASALVQAAGLTKLVDLNAVLQRAVAKTIDLTAVLERGPVRPAKPVVITRAANRTAYVRQEIRPRTTLVTGVAELPAPIDAEIKTVAVSAVLRATGLTKQVTVAAVVQRASLTKSVNLSATLMGAGNKTISLSAVLQGTATKSVAASAVVGAVVTQSVSTSAVLQGTSTKTVAVGALLSGVLSKAVTVSAVVARAGLTQTVDTSAVLQGRGTKTVSISGYLLGIEGKVVSVSAVLAKQGNTKTVAATAHLGAQLTKTVVADALLGSSGLAKSVTLSAVLQARASKVVAASAVLSGSLVQTVGVDAVLRRTGLTKSVNLTAALQGANSKLVSVTAVLQGTEAQQVTASAVLQRRESKSVAVSARLLVVQGKVASVDAVLVKQGITRTVTTTAVLARTGLTKQVTFDATVTDFVRLTKLVTLDALVAAPRFWFADPVVRPVYQLLPRVKQVLTLFARAVQP